MSRSLSLNPAVGVIAPQSLDGRIPAKTQVREIGWQEDLSGPHEARAAHRGVNPLLVRP